MVIIRYKQIYRHKLKEIKHYDLTIFIVFAILYLISYFLMSLKFVVISVINMVSL